MLAVRDLPWWKDIYLELNGLLYSRTGHTLDYFVPAVGLAVLAIGCCIVVWWVRNSQPQDDDA